MQLHLRGERLRRCGLLRVHRRRGIPPPRGRIRCREAGVRPEPRHGRDEGHERVQGPSDKAQIRCHPDRQGCPIVPDHNMQQDGPMQARTRRRGGEDDKGRRTHVRLGGHGGGHAGFARILSGGCVRVHGVPPCGDGRLRPVRQAHAHRPRAGGRPRSEGMDGLSVRSDPRPISSKPGSAC